MRKSWKGVSLTLLVAAMAVACTSTAPAPVTVERHLAERNALNAMARNNTALAIDAWQAALSYYESVDDADGQWRARYSLASIEFRAGDIESATRYAEELQQLADRLESNEADYKTSLLLGRLYNDRDYFESARRLANDPLARALANVHLGNTDEALAVINDNNVGTAADRAFIYYQHGKQANSKSSLTAALDAYRAARDARGVADSLVALAQLEAGAGNTALAGELGRRAITVLQSIQDTQRATAVTQWLESL